MVMVVRSSPYSSLSFLHIKAASPGSIKPIRAGWASYHIHHNLHNFGKILPKDVIELEQKAPQYIYYHPSFSGRAQIEAFWLPQYLWWWRSVPSSVAWRLLRLAQSGCLRERMKAVNSLALLENLEDSDCYQIAQACDVRTSVGLARTKGVDLRLFLKPPVYPPPIRKEDLIDRCHEMLVLLNNGEAHECVQYFVSQVLSEVQKQLSNFAAGCLQFLWIVTSKVNSGFCS
ncbi:hypothetical protein J437_LFUL011519 [Ladona fulva]|uniref:Uncharacterized protein n=1 Tax=Ladona fulva TaxID=123851 RepID=A0A8K0KEJ0_LADFU|nr:hypothetical protein J437_LFUL011519 [Ladona fulva]